MLKILPKEFMWRELGEVDGHTTHDPRFLLLGRMNADPVPAAAAMCNAMGQAIWGTTYLKWFYAGFVIVVRFWSGPVSIDHYWFEDLN